MGTDVTNSEAREVEPYGATSRVHLFDQEIVMQHRSWVRVFGLALLSLWATLAVLPAAGADSGRRSRKAARHHTKVVQRLPSHHVEITVGGRPFYFHAGVFYRRAPSGYSIVAAPIGARVRVLPRGHRTAVVGGVDYYVYFGTYYRYRPEERIYVVVSPPVEDLPGDVIYLLDGESMVGRFVGGSETAITFEVEGEIHHVSISEIVAIHFEPPG